VALTEGLSRVLVEDNGKGRARRQPSVMSMAPGVMGSWELPTKRDSVIENVPEGAKDSFRSMSCLPLCCLNRKTWGGKYRTRLRRRQPFIFSVASCGRAFRTTTVEVLRLLAS